MSRNLIYGLIDPISKELRYVGKSTTGLKRPRQHGQAWSLSKTKTHCSNWVRSLLKNNFSYEIEVLEEHNDAQSLYEAEQFWISYFKSIGCNLTNHTDGGAGVLGMKHSEHTKKNWSLNRKGRKLSEATKAKMSVARLGRRMAQSTKDKLSLSKRGIKIGPMSEAHKKSISGGPIIDNFNNVYESISHAARKLNITPAMVSRVVNGSRKQTAGYVFKKVE